MRHHTHRQKELKTPCTVVTVDERSNSTKYVIVNLEKADKPNTIVNKSVLNKWPENQPKDVAGCCVYRDLVFGESIRDYNEDLRNSSERGYRNTVNSTQMANH